MKHIMKHIAPSSAKWHRFLENGKEAGSSVNEFTRGPVL